jgi:hypothetical protein
MSLQMSDRLLAHLKRGRQLMLWRSQGLFMARWAGDPTREGSGTTLQAAVDDLLEQG